MTDKIQEQIETLNGLGNLSDEQRAEMASTMQCLRDALEAVPGVIPTSWLDPLLSGKNAVIVIPAGCQDIERLLGVFEEKLKYHIGKALSGDE